MGVFVRLIVTITAAITVLSGAIGAEAVEVILLAGQRYVGDVRASSDTVFVKVDRTTYNIPRGSVRAVRLFGAEVSEFERRK